MWNTAFCTFVLQQSRSLYYSHVLHYSLVFHDNTIPCIHASKSKNVYNQASQRRKHTSQSNTMVWTETCLNNTDHILRKCRQGYGWSTRKHSEPPRSFPSDINHGWDLKLEFHRESRTHRAASGRKTWCWSGNVSRPDASRCVRFSRWNSSLSHVNCGRRDERHVDRNPSTYGDSRMLFIYPSASRRDT